MTFPIFQTIENAVHSIPAPSDTWILRQSATKLSHTDHIIYTPARAQAFVEELYRLPVGGIAIDTEFRYDAPGVELNGGRTWYDPSTLNPLILTGAAWVPSEGRAIRFLFDLRVPGMGAVVAHLLRLRTTFVAHNLKAEFQTFWALGCAPIMAQTYDTFLAARALLMGHGHRLIELRRSAQHDEDWGQLEEANTQLASLLSLSGQCEAYDISHPYTHSKGTLQESFLNHSPNDSFSDAQINYALADAEFTLRLYLAQQPDIMAAGLQSHLYQVEFPYAEANARMEYDGVPVDRKELADLAHGLQCAIGREASKLKAYGLDNPASAPQVIKFLKARGWHAKIMRKGKPSSADTVLQNIVELDPAVSHIRRFRRYKALLNGQFLSGELIGSDGRLHPNHRHLGAETGRNTCSAPNVVGLPRDFRPIVVAPLGRAIVEADYAQIEVGIAAAEAGDVALIDAFNSGDVYAEVARNFYKDTLTKQERQMPLAEFKAARGDLRNKIKVFVLATLYNMQDQAVADQFGITLEAAKKQRATFLGQYPGIGKMMTDAERDGRMRGFAPIMGGLRRHIGQGYNAANKHMNTPIQAGAGVVFRRAVVDLYQHFRGTQTKLLLPVHDAVVVECESANVTSVSLALELMMGRAVKTYYPTLEPRIDVNASAQHCWNKDGDANALRNFLQEAMTEPPGVDQHPIQIKA